MMRHLLKTCTMLLLSITLLLTCSLSFAGAATFNDDSKEISDSEIITPPKIYEEVIYDDGSPDPENLRAKYTAKTPFYGKSADYTKKQQVKNGTLEGDKKIRNYTINGLAILCFAISGNLKFLDVADGIIKVCDSYNSNTKNLYYTKTRYGHKNMPGVYHKFVVKWYIDKAKTKYAKTTTYYDSTQ